MEGNPRQDSLDIPARRGIFSRPLSRFALAGKWETGPFIPFSVCLAIASLISKGMLLPFKVSSVAEFLRWVLRLAVVASPDLVFIAGLSIVCGLLTALVERWRRAIFVWRPVLYALFGLAGVYTVVSVPMFRVTMVPFTARLIAFAGGPVMMRSSVEQYLDTTTIVALFVAPLSLLLSPLVLRRWTWFRLGAPIRRGVALASIAGVTLYGAVCHAYIRSNWTDPNRWEKRIAQSPHAVFLASCVEELLKDKPFTYSFSFEEIDDGDFLPPGSIADGKTDGNGPTERPFTPSIPSEERPKNLIYVVLESTAVEYLSLYGSRHATTPKLEKLAADRGIVFENMYAQVPASSKSLVSLIASVYCRPDWRLITRDCPDFDVPTITEVLRDHGYRNCFVHGGYWDWRGRDDFLKSRGVETMLDAHDLESAPANSWGARDRAMFQRALDWIDGHHEQPFFVCAFTIETHHPYTAGDSRLDFGVEDEEFGRYLNALRVTDDNLAFLMEELEWRGLSDSTLVAITADHGECFGQHNQRVHGFGLYEPNIHVPCVLLGPGLKDRPRRDKTVRQQIDLPATLLSALGIEPPAAWQGQDMLADFPERRAYFCSMSNQVTLGLRDGRYKYHYYVDTNAEELFDLEHDPKEAENLASQCPDRVAGYRRRVGGFVQHQRQFLEEHGAGRIAGEPVARK